MRRAAVVLAVVVLTGLFGRAINFPELAGGFKSDEGTYVTMAFSLANDFDLKYEQRDLRRFGTLYGAGSNGRPVGPEGIFLKKTARSTDAQLDFGKAFAYPLFAAPFARLGGLGGMFMFNILLLAICVYCAVRFATARLGNGWGPAIGVIFVAASSVPVWAFWLMPEVFNFTLVFVAYFLWLYKEVRPGGRTRQQDFLGGVWSDVAAAALIALATYSKPSNAALIAPLVTYALWKRAPAKATIVALVFVAGTGAWFGATRLIAGEWNYQSGARKTFYGNFPFDADGSTFETARNSNGMSVITGDAGQQKVSSDILFPGDPRFWPLFRHNARYFVMGRDAGLIPYFFPGAVLLLLWAVRVRRAEFWQWCVLAAAAGTALILIFWFPYTWNGAGGPPGNRYYLSIYPLFLFLLPASTGAVTALVSVVGGLAFMWPLFAHPILAKNQPWLHPATVPLRWLPVERTMMNEIGERLLPARYKIPFGDPRNAFLYRMDGNAYDGEPFADGFGFWIAGDASTEIVVATGFQNAHVRLTVTSPIANTFSANWGGARCALTLTPDNPQICDLYTNDAIWAHDSYFYSLKMRTSAGFVPADVHPPSADTRNLGVRVVPIFSER